MTNLIASLHNPTFAEHVLFIALVVGWYLFIAFLGLSLLYVLLKIFSNITGKTITLKQIFLNPKFKNIYILIIISAVVIAITMMIYYGLIDN